MTKKSKRGGDRLTGRKMPANTSGLNAIGFFVSQAGTRCVRVAFGAKRSEYSTNAHGITGALKLAIIRRESAGLPAPSLATARRAFNAFDWEDAAERAGVELVQR